MDDELNIAPRETDYLDDYDSSRVMHYNDLKVQAQELGFLDPLVTEDIWNMVIGNGNCMTSIRSKTAGILLYPMKRWRIQAIVCTASMPRWISRQGEQPGHAIPSGGCPGKRSD